MTRYIGYLVVEAMPRQTPIAVEIVGETRTKYRIRAIHRTWLGGRARWIEPGTAALVRKRAIFTENGKPFRFEVHP